MGTGRSTEGAGEAARGSLEPPPGAAEPQGVAAQSAAANGDPTGDAGNDPLDERVRAAAEAAEERAAEEIEALDEDLERARERAEGLLAELERTEAALNEALAKTGQAEGNVDKEAARRAAAEAESERVRGELERLRNEIVERVLEVVEDVVEDVVGKARLEVEQSSDDEASEVNELTATASEAVVAVDADQPRRTRRLGWPLGVIVGAVVLAAGAGMLTGVTTADSAKPAVETARSDQALLTYERTLRREVTALDRSRTPQLKRLRDAHSASDQAAAAEDLATAHARAARSLDRTSAPASVASENDSVVSALSQTADAYRQLAAGAATRRPAAYEAGATAVRRAEAKLQHSLKASSSRPL